MNKPEKALANEITNRLINVAGFKKLQFQMYIYYNYAGYVSNLVVLSYVDD